MSARRATTTRGVSCGCSRTSSPRTPRRFRSFSPTTPTIRIASTRSRGISATTRRRSRRSRLTRRARGRSRSRQTPRWSSCGEVMTMLKPFVCLTVAVPLALTVPAQPAQPQLAAFFAQMDVTDQQRATIDAGKPVAKVLHWGGPSEVYVFGAIHIDGSPDAYLKLARNVTRLAGSSGYLAAGELPATVNSADVGGLTLDPDDIKALKSCREGDCDVQLPTAAITAFKDAVNWSSPDPAGQVNGLARGMVLDLVREYRRGGNTALGVYRDKEHPARVADQFETLVGRSSVLPDALPELRQYLLKYPDVELPGSD